MRLYLLLTLLSLAMIPAHAESRRWQNKDGTKFVIADYLRHDALTVTVKRPDGKIINLNRTDIHANDVAYLDTLPGAKAVKGSEKTPAADQPVSDNDCVFDNLKLGESHKEVKEKVLNSKLLELTVDETYLGRFGLNGSFRTKASIGGLHCLLYFDWDNDMNLKELTMQTQPLGVGSYNSSLKDNWNELIKLMTTLHGRPLQAAHFPHSGLLQDNMSLSTHIWRLPNEGTAMLGTSKSPDGFTVSVRFTTETIKPAVIKK